ncbi:MAG: hypothetical protein V3T85_05860 [Acidiferrobacterales bacterium]|jgi:hypothetical protein
MPSKATLAHASKTGARAEAQVRQRISAEAARIMCEEGVRDFQTAKRKAANRLNLPDGKNLPANQEVESALHEYLQLFHAERLSGTLAELRTVAIEAMRFFAAFDPRVVGSVLSGVVTAESVVQLHVCADTPEEIGHWLQDHNIPYEETDRRIRYGGERYDTRPVYRFDADTTAVEVYVFEPQSAREPPLSPVDGKPMRRATIRELEAITKSPAPASFPEFNAPD